MNLPSSFSNEYEEGASNLEDEALDDESFGSHDGE